MKTTALIVVAGIAAAAGAQTMTISWTYTDNGNGDGIIDNGETGAATMWAAMNPDQSGNQGGFAGSIYDISGDSRLADGTSTYDNFLDALTDEGNNLGGGNITGILGLFTGKDTHKGGLTCSVATQQSDDFSLVYMQIDPIENWRATQTISKICN